MENLKVPLGLTIEGNLVSAKYAEKGCDYFCPVCKENIILKDGEKRTKHFSHPADSTCEGETILHKTAKMLIFKAIEENHQKNRSLSINNKCHCCENIFETKLEPGTFSGAKLEKPVSNYICDVVAYRNLKPCLAIEICVTNPINDVKAENLPLYWIELKAEDVIEDCYVWNPTKKRLKETYCEQCKVRFKNIQEVADRWGIDRALYSVTKKPAEAIYIAGIETCFSCKEKIPIFWWSGIPFCEDEPPAPKPKTIQQLFSKQFGGKYWANTCANCRMIQGDNHLFISPSAPMKDLPQSKKYMPKHAMHRENSHPATEMMMGIIKRNIV